MFFFPDCCYFYLKNYAASKKIIFFSKKIIFFQKKIKRIRQDNYVEKYIYQWRKIVEGTYTWWSF
jgi:hypothetical protein